MSRLKTLMVMMALGTNAWPCGPDFPLEFLSHRDATLALLPDGLFNLEARRLVTPSLKLKAMESEPPADARSGGGERERALYAKAAAAWKGSGAPHFEAVLTLPAADRRRFTVPALYMLAQLEPDDALAAKEYAQLRANAADGFEDVFGLAVASLGEEARRAKWAGDDVRAVVLYAEQASYDSQSGASSLLFMARQLASNAGRLDVALKEPVVQRLMSMYLWSRSTEAWWSESPDHPNISNVLAAMLKLPHVQGADHLAAALYRAGRFDDAAKVVMLEDSGVANWVKAKLALRDGNVRLADDYLSGAEAKLNAVEDWQWYHERRPLQQVQVERAILALSRDDFDAAMGFARASCSWQDLAWVAERVIDVDSLKRIVDTLPAVDPCSAHGFEGYDGFVVPDNQHLKLRALLARRLMRADRGREALSYLDASVRGETERYINARETAERTKDHLERAARLFEAAKITRSKGMELFGTEVGPDYAWAGGFYEPHHHWSWGDDPVDAGRTKQEEARASASAPREGRRFHYRYDASRLAEEAANSVSPRSQAFVAMLCTAARFVADSDQARVEYLFRRWVKEGPLLPGNMPMVFGRDCPTPNFVEPPPVKPKPMRLRKRWVVVITAWAVVSGVAVAASLRRRRTPPRAAPRT